MDGELMANGLIERSSAELFLERDEFKLHKFGRNLLIYYAIEAWLRAWKVATVTGHQDLRHT